MRKRLNTTYVQFHVVFLRWGEGRMTDQVLRSMGSVSCCCWWDAARRSWCFDSFSVVLVDSIRFLASSSSSRLWANSRRFADSRRLPVVYKTIRILSVGFKNVPWADGIASIGTFVLEVATVLESNQNLTRWWFMKCLLLRWLLRSSLSFAISFFVRLVTQRISDFSQVLDRESESRY